LEICVYTTGHIHNAKCETRLFFTYLLFILFQVNRRRRQRNTRDTESQGSDRIKKQGNICTPTEQLQQSTERQEKPLQQKRITYWKCPTHTATPPLLPSYKHTHTVRARRWESKPTSFYGRREFCNQKKSESRAVSIGQPFDKPERREQPSSAQPREAENKREEQVAKSNAQRIWKSSQPKVRERDRDRLYVAKKQRKRYRNPQIRTCI